MIATLEPVGFVIRVHREPGVMPLPYIGSAYVSFDDLRVATIRGLVMPAGYGRGARQAILDKLAEHGAVAATWTRKSHGEERVVRVPLWGDGRVLYL